MIKLEELSEYKGGIFRLTDKRATKELLLSNPKQAKICLEVFEVQKELYGLKKEYDSDPLYFLGSIYHANYRSVNDFLEQEIKIGFDEIARIEIKISRENIKTVSGKRTIKFLRDSIESINKRIELSKKYLRKN